jgi:5'-nucleotidase
LLILVTNDDGIHSPGLTALVRALAEMARVIVVAPDRERSAASHSLTLNSPLRAAEIRPDTFIVDGTPTDCVNLGIHGLLESRPDLVVSGINRGANLGEDITYSGTVSAAMEALLMGVPAFAISQAGPAVLQEDFISAARFAVKLAGMVTTHGLPVDTFLNVNVPEIPARGVKMTRQGKRRYEDLVVEKTDPRGRKYYWIGGGNSEFEKIDGSDFQAIDTGYISVTPLHVDLTNYRSFDALAEWNSKGQGKFFTDPSE